MGYIGGLERDKLCASYINLVWPIYTFGSHIITEPRFYAGRVYVRELGAVSRRAPPNFRDNPCDNGLNYGNLIVTIVFSGTDLDAPTALRRR